MHVTGSGRGLEEGRPEALGFSPERLGQLRETLEDEVARGLMPGAVVLIARHGRIAFCEALGWRDRTAAAPMPRDAIFRIASMSKPITSVAVMTLVEQGRIQLDHPLSVYLPRFEHVRVAVPRSRGTGEGPAFDLVRPARPPTVHDLLRHTAGFTYQFFDTAVAHLYRAADLRGRDLSNAELADELAALPLAFEPGSGWNYSHATDLLGRVVEVVSGQSLLEWERERILEPLGLIDTSFWIEDRSRHGRVAEPAPADDVAFGTRLHDPRRPRTGQMGGSGMQSTALDYARFLQMLLNGGALEGRRVLSPPTVRFMTSDHLGERIGPGPTQYLPGPGYGFGLGFAVRRSWGEAPHAGPPGLYCWAGSAGTLFWCDTVHDLLTVFLAQAPGQLARWMTLVPSLVYAALVEPDT